MAELTKTGDHALGLFNGIETAGRPDNHCRRGNDADNTPAHRSTRPLRYCRRPVRPCRRRARQVFYLTCGRYHPDPAALLATAFIAISLRVAASLLLPTGRGPVRYYRADSTPCICSIFVFDIPTGVNIFRQAARLNHIVNKRWLLLTEAPPVNDRHAHLQTHAAVILHPLFFYRLKLIETASQSPFFRR